MSALVFLILALVLSAIGSAILVLRTRKPSTSDWSIQEFRREMRALSPDDERYRPRYRRPRRMSDADHGQQG